METLSAVLLMALTLLATPVFGNDTSVLPQKDFVSIRQVTLSQIFRYAREEYRKGNYREATPAFKKMLAIDCRNAVAQYHIQQILHKDPASKDLESYLNALPCPKYNFPEEDFLPAFIYYEKDPDLLQEQIIAYNQRYRLEKVRMNEQVASYSKLADELSQKITVLEGELSAETDLKTQAVDALNQKLEESRAAAQKMSDEIAKLRLQLNDDRQERQKNLAALKENFSHSMEQATTQAQETTSATAFSVDQNDEFATLEEKFEALQKRLKLIQAEIQNKNAQIKSMGKNLKETQH
ncbi:MAG: hypothetical protein HQL16_08240 [Candidatus Omnitrophica bacterium]|nr:hypothetical protein [Candidatus Omnitrophota bacterium]